MADMHPGPSSSTPAQSSRSSSISNGGSVPVRKSPSHKRFAEAQRVGGVRCYWALLTPRMLESSEALELVFVHPDPVLAVHLAAQKMSMMGRGVIEFIHPAERERESRRPFYWLRAAGTDGPSVKNVARSSLLHLRLPYLYIEPRTADTQRPGKI